MKIMPKISVVVPVYNTERYLRQCLDSLVNQTFKDIEIICVNDESTDNSLEVLKEYESKDNRIVIIDQQNTGLSDVRNNAIKIAKGEYITFFDSDDWVELNTFEILYDMAMKHNAYIVIFSYFREYNNKSVAKNIFNQEEIVFDKSGCEYLHRFQMGLIEKELKNLERADSICSAWTNLYRLNIINDNNLRFIDTKIIGTFEDGLFNIEYYKYIDKAVYINKCLYHYRKLDINSLTTRYNKGLLDKWNNLFCILEDYIERNKLESEYNEALNNRIAFSIIGIGLNLITSNLKFNDKIKEIRVILKNEKVSNSINKIKVNNMSIHWKVFFVCCKLKFYFGIYLLLFVMNKLRTKV